MERAVELFPYKPYDIQRDFCREFARITAGGADGGARIGILESPTGTGKTTSLLCSALAWILEPAAGADGGENYADKANDVDGALDEPEWVRQARSELEGRKRGPVPTAARPSRKRRKRGTTDLDESIQHLLSIVGDSEEEGDGPVVVPARRVYYCSRTHAQLAQVMSELRRVLAKTPLEVRAVTLAARKSTCINEAVRRLPTTEAVNQRCQELLAEDGCPYHNRDKSAALAVLKEAYAQRAVVDIEEAVALGRQHEACPYFATRGHAPTAEIATVPYNMILSRATREALEIDLRGALVIFDEAHNLVDAINDMEGCLVSVEEVQTIADALRPYLGKFERRLKPDNLVLLQQLQQVTSRILDRCTEAADARVWTVNAFLAECKIDHINMLKIVDYVRESHLSVKLASYSRADNENNNGNKCNGDDEPAGLRDNQLLNRFAKVLAALVAADDDGRLIKSGAALKYVALNPAKVMAELREEAHSIVLAGGTMKPIDDVILQLFGASASAGVHSHFCGHLESVKRNVLGLVIGSGPAGGVLRFTHAAREDRAMLAELQQTLANVCTVVPDGVVCFFPSYRALDHFVANWTTRPALEAKKAVFIESTAKGAVERLLQHYQHAVNTGRGALMLGVMGGRLSEGVNFSDRLARAVVVVGQPFPNMQDAETRERANRYAQGRGDGAVREYLENICMRTVNQTVGRAIRHAGDYAAIVLLDERYARLRTKLPEWMQHALFPDRGASDFSPAFAQLVKVPMRRSI